jgi:hypothetical protein
MRRIVVQVVSVQRAGDVPVSEQPGSDAREPIAHRVELRLLLRRIH